MTAEKTFSYGVSAFLCLCAAVAHGETNFAFRGVVVTDYRAAIADFAAHCRAAGVRSAMEIGFEKDYASGVVALRCAGIPVSTTVYAVGDTFPASKEAAG